MDKSIYRPPAHLAMDVFDRCIQLLPIVRQAARACGYAIASHGSMMRDLDLVAVPWTEDASEPEELVRTVLDALNARPEWQPFYAKDRAHWSIKPHGRVATSLYTGGEAAVQCSAGSFPFIDMSILPRSASAA